MTSARFLELSSRYADLRVAVVGDFCLDRYFEIDPTRTEISIETGLPVHNVTNVRCQPGGAGTILNNLVALGLGRVAAVGCCGEDGEGFELRRALAKQRGVSLDHFVQSVERHTFTYSKPLVLAPGKSPEELSRLDIKNWTPTPEPVQALLCDAFERAAAEADAIILLDQVDLPETGVVTKRLLATVERYATAKPGFLIVADSRRSLRGFPPVTLKMNVAELSALTEAGRALEVAEVKVAAAQLARAHGRNVFVTMAERGIVGATPDGIVQHELSLPVRGEIDIVGAGDAVTANLTAALAAGATLREALRIAMCAASLVIHQLGTTGTASVPQLREILSRENAA